MTIREDERAVLADVWVRVERDVAPARPRSRGQRTRSREVVAWLISAVIAVGAVAYAYRPWPGLWGAVVVLFVAFAVWVPDVFARRAWRPTMTIAAALAGLLVAYGAIACVNEASEFSERLGRLEPSPHLAFLPAAVDAANALPTLVAIAAALATLVMATDLGKSARLRRRFFAALALGGLVTAIVGVVEQLPAFTGVRQWDAASPWFHGQPFGLLSYQNHAATMMNVAMPALALVTLGASRGRRIAASLGIAALALAAVVNVSRTGLAIGSVVATLSMATLWTARPTRGRRRAWMPLAAGVAVIGSIVAVLAIARPAVVVRLAQMNGENRFAGVFPRELHWRAGLELFEREPILGIGPGGYRMLVLTTSTKGYYLGGPLAPGQPFNPTANALNDYLQTLAEWGLVGSALWLILLLGAVQNAFVALTAPGADGASRREVLLVMLAAAAIFAHSLIDPPLQAPLFQFIAAILVGLLWVARRWRADPAATVASFFDSPARVSSRLHV